VSENASPTAVGASMHGGLLALRTLEQAGSGIDTVFTLSGGHIFPLLDAAHQLGWRIVDVRHEQTAVFAAEGMAKTSRVPGLAALTAGPGVTNGISALTGAFLNGTPLLVFGGRAPEHRWGSGSLQELDHIPIVSSVTKYAATASDTSAIQAVVLRALHEATSAHRGPAFVDFPLDAVGAQAELAPLPPRPPTLSAELDLETIARVGALLDRALRPAVVAGADVYWAHAEHALVALAEAHRLPVFTNGLGRGTMPADHPLAFSRSRPLLKQADVVVVVGTPLDFRLSFGRFGEAHVVHVVDAEGRRATHAATEATLVGDVRTILEHLARSGGTSSTNPDRRHWLDRLGGEEAARRATEQRELESDAYPIHPARVYGELRKRLDRDAVVVGDGGDFVSYAGKLVDSYEPGTFLEPGPFGCLGTGMGYAAAARLAHPGRQIVACLGDGAFGFSAMDVDTLVRHRLPVVMVLGNNGIWGLEKHPMRFFYGYDVAADLRQETRYDEIVAALGGAGETVRLPAEIGPALDRAFRSGVPYLVNVLTDPGVAYPRSSNLA
jgi:acetolactate synthase-1/2/3 large subunit